MHPSYSGGALLGTEELLIWLRQACSEYELEPRAVFRRGLREDWPLSASSDEDLEAQLDSRGHFLPLPKEPAALANVVEVSIVDFLMDRLSALENAEGRRGTERSYPDVEVCGKAFGGAFHAIDIKVARRSPSKRQTKSRITLYTGNTYFRYPELAWPATLRPFNTYGSHLDLIVLYTFNPDRLSRIEDVELIAHEAWRIASRERSPTTREYIGAVKNIEDLRVGKGDFDSEQAFYDYWRKFPFKIGRAVEQQLRRLVKEDKK